MNLQTKRFSIGPRRQRGAALAVGLFFLLLLTMIATVAMRQSITQEKMAGGLHNISLARNGAESALRQAERNIYTWYQISNGTALVGDASASQDIYLLTATNLVAFRSTDDYITAGTLAYAAHDYTSTAANPTAALAEQPVYVVSDLGRLRPPGAGTVGEGGSTGKENYEGSGAISGGNSDIRVYRVTARSTGGLPTVVRTTESTYAGRAKG